MYPANRNCAIFAGLALSLLSFIAIFINYLSFQFKGNNYIPEGSYQAGLCLLLILLGFRLYFDKNNYFSKLTQSIVSLFVVMFIIALATNAAQLTPFPAIDKHLVAFENSLWVDMSSIVAWTAKHEWLKFVLTKIYDTLPYQMIIFPILIAVLGQFKKLQEYYSLMMLCALFTFIFYYFFPTTAPASIIQSPYFLPEQYATGIKFVEIHNHLLPSTIEGGMIAFPSFHVIWAWLCCYLVRGYQLLLALLLPLNTLLTLSCVLLGWHYTVDILGSLIVMATAFTVHWFFTADQEDFFDLKSMDYI